ncbi:MAG: nucleoside hydrolase [Chthoniobacterales bacterium]
MRPVIVDTDIGTDVDDLLALVLLAKAVEIQLCGVTTVHGDTILRAKIARVACDLLGYREVAVVAGESDTLTNRPIFWAGHEGKGIGGLDNAEIGPKVSVEGFLAQSARKFAGSLEILGIAPLTNLARAVLGAPDFAVNVKRLYLMGGAYWLPYHEHNIETDPEAAQTVFRSGIPITAIGLDVTLRVPFTESDLPRIHHLPKGLGPMLEDQVRRWWRYLGEPRCYLHDPLTALAMLQPELFVFEDHAVAIDDAGYTRIREDVAGKIAIAKDVVADRAKEAILGYIAAEPREAR